LSSLQEAFFSTLLATLDIELAAGLPVIISAAVAAKT
jgi:hypothetical protein